MNFLIAKKYSFVWKEKDNLNDWELIMEAYADYEHDRVCMGN